MDHRGIEKMGPRTFRIRVRGKNPRTGKMKEVDRVVDDIDLREAVRLREEYHAELTADVRQEPLERQTVGTYAESWLRTRLPMLKPSTATWYSIILDLHILPTFGDLYVDAVTRRDVKEWVARQAASARPATVNGRIALLKMLLGEAASDFNVPDPTTRVRPIPSRDTEPRRHALTADELRRLLDVVREADPEQYPLLLTLALFGCRWGEATALLWRDIDETEGTVRVVRAHVRGRVSTTKTGKARVYPLVPELAEVLREHRKRLVADQHPGLALGLVFPTTDREGKEARLACPRSWAKALPRWLKAAGIAKHITPHSLRRTNVDLLRRAQVDAVVARSLVGHATEQMREHYSTVASDEQHDAVSRVVRLVQGGR